MFIIGGVMYEEVKMVVGINVSSFGVRVVLGGMMVYNVVIFLEEVEGVVDGWLVDF